MNKRFFILFLSIISVFITNQKAKAWGPIGHHTAAQIAYDILKSQNSNALIEVKNILNADDFIKSSTWADEARGSDTENWKQTGPYHYEKMDDGDEYLPHLETQSREVKAQGGVVQATMVAENILKNKNSTALEKKYALKFMIHFVADIHQPMHTGRIADKGGNSVRVKWLGFDLNLHQVWDSQIIALGHADLFEHGNQSEQVDQYSNYLVSKFKNAVLPNENDLTYEDWIHESMVPRADAYTYKNEDAKKYTARFINTVDERIYLSGLRLSYVLNRIFPGYNGPGMPMPSGQKITDQFQFDVTKIMGDLNKIIILKPSLIF